MKKKILASAFVLFTALNQLSAFAAGVAVVDTKKVLESSSLMQVYNSAKQEVENFKKESENMRTTKSKELETAREKKATEAELKKMLEQFQKDLSAREQQGLALEDTKRKELDDLSTKFRTKVDDAIKSIAQEKKLDVVVAKEAILFGGIDITDDVIKKVK
jgi:outer membrane protein